MGYARWRVIGAAAVVAVSAAFGPASPAKADVTIQPGEFAQGDSAELTFRVTNDGPTGSPLARVEFRLPADTPVAEVLPMSTEGWGERDTTRTLDRPMTTLHGGVVDRVTASVTFIARPGGELPAGGSVEFRLSMFNLPEVPNFTVPVVLTFLDGTTVNQTGLPGAQPAAGERPAPTIALVAPPAIGAEQPAADAAAEPAAPADDRGGDNAVWLFGLLLLIGTITAVALLRQRRDTGHGTGLTAADDDDDENEDADREIAPANSR